MAEGKKVKSEKLSDELFALILSLTKTKKLGVIQYADCPLCNGKNTIYYTRAIPSGKFSACCMECGLKF